LLSGTSRETFRHVRSFFQRLQPAHLSFIDLLQGVIQLGLWHVWVLLALDLRVSQFLIVTQDSRRPVGEREDQSLGAIRRSYATLAGLIFGFLRHRADAEDHPV
jgi:hypothetical protein